MLTVEDQLNDAFALCKLQAASDGAFPDELLKHWFDAAWDLCAAMVDLVFPAQQVVEAVRFDRHGRLLLTHQPSSDVRIYEGYTLIAVLPPSLERTRCDPSLCCRYNLTAHYEVGTTDPCQAISPRFVQAVARVFTYLVENRGDVLLDADVLSKSGAMLFLSHEVLYVA